MYKKKAFLVVILLFSGFLFFNIDVSSKNPVLSYDPTYYNFGDMIAGVSDSQVFYIWNGCCLCDCPTLYYTLTENCDWIGISSTSGSSRGEKNPITITIDTTGLIPGYHSCSIQISSNGGNGSIGLKVRVIDNTNSPPGKPSITGKIYGVAGKENLFTANSIDFNGDKIYYKFSWGDGNYSDWLGLYTSGHAITESYAWDEAGKYSVKVIAKDEYGLESEWSDSIVVSMAKKVNEIDSLVLRYLEILIDRFPKFILIFGEPLA